MTAPIAQKAVENCIKAYKERLIGKEKLIQARIDRETKLLKKYHNAFHKNPDMDKDDEEEYERAIQEATFRKRILEKRLAKVVAVHH